MARHFASPAVQTTTGARGKSTGRKATRTVRGNDGAYCAMVKEELCAAPPTFAWEVKITRRSPVGYRFYGKYPPAHTVEDGRCVIVESWCEQTEAKANERAAWYMGQGWVKDYWSEWEWTAEVRLVGRVWKMVRGQLVQVVCEYHN